MSSAAYPPSPSPSSSYSRFIPSSSPVDAPFSPPASHHSHHYPPPSPAPSLTSPSHHDSKSHSNSRLLRSSSGPALFASDLLSQPLSTKSNKGKLSKSGKFDSFALNSTLNTTVGVDSHSHYHAQNAKNFKVCVRIRPPLPKEIESDGVEQYRDCTRVHGSNSAVTLSEAPMVNSQPPALVDPSLLPCHTFTFDRVFDQDAQQDEVYQETTKSAVMAVLEGYNATILAYGQTGTGKTYTMEGFDDISLRGIIPRAVEEIFQFIDQSASGTSHFLVRASFIQIYNEVISDLLKPDRTNLLIREDKKRGVFVEGLSEWVVRNPREVLGLIKRGSAVRATGATRINDTSSRSHAIFQLIIEQSRVEESDAHTEAPKSRKHKEVNPTVYRFSKLTLVDLAGSERVRISGAKGARLEESKYINQSLSALGNVISALIDGKRNHIPVRDSKLTRILQDSLGGNSITTMLATISPAPENFLESLSTLKFANRAKNITNSAKINEDLDEKALLRRYERELKQLRAELNERNQQVIDKRKLIEIEENMKRVEADKHRVLQNLEQLSRDLLHEKHMKQQLEAKIQEMNSQLLTGHAGGAVGGQLAAKLQQEYEKRMAELERERESIANEKQQSGKYKQLLLKQRDIMIQLTNKLSERDEAIIALQAQVEEKEKTIADMEEELDQNRLRLVMFERQAVEQGLKAPAADLGLSLPVSPGRAERELHPIDEEEFFAQQQQYEVKINQLMKEISVLKEEKAEELEVSAQSSVQSALAAQQLEVERKRILQLERESDDKEQRMAVLMAENEQLTKQAHQHIQHHAEIAALRKRFEVQAAERSAIKVILEKKMKALVDSIAAAMQAEPIHDRTRKQVEVLQKLIDASVHAMNNGERQENPEDQPEEHQDHYANQSPIRNAHSHAIPAAYPPSASPSSASTLSSSHSSSSSTLEQIQQLLAARQAEATHR